MSCMAAPNARSGRRTVLEVNSIVATVGHTGNPGNTRHDYVPPLNNQTLFRRDAYLCMYCSQRFASRELSRDHIRPFSQGGTDIWTNVVAACRRCNNQKASRTPEQARMQLIAVPFMPTYAEYIFLKGDGCWPIRWNTWWHIFRARARCTTASSAGCPERRRTPRAALSAWRSCPPAAKVAPGMSSGAAL